MITLDSYKVQPVREQKPHPKQTLSEMCKNKACTSYHIDGLYWAGLKYKPLLLSGTFHFLIGIIPFNYLMSLIQSLWKVLWIAKTLSLKKKIFFLYLHRIFLSFTTFQISYLNNSHITKNLHSLTFLKMELLGQRLVWFRYVTKWHFLHGSSQKVTLNYTLQTHYAKVYGLHFLLKK